MYIEFISNVMLYSWFTMYDLLESSILISYTENIMLKEEISNFCMFTCYFGITTFLNPLQVQARIFVLPCMMLLNIVICMSVLFTLGLVNAWTGNSLVTMLISVS